MYIIAPTHCLEKAKFVLFLNTGSETFSHSVSFSLSCSLSLPFFPSLHFTALTIKTIQPSWKEAQLSLSPSLLPCQNIYCLKEGPGTLALKHTLSFSLCFYSPSLFWNSTACVCVWWGWEVGGRKRENVNKIEFCNGSDPFQVMQRLKYRQKPFLKDRVLLILFKFKLRADARIVRIDTSVNQALKKKTRFRHKMKILN